MDFDSYLKQTGLFNEEELTRISSSFDERTIPKGTVIEGVNQFSERMIFIESGLLRTFFYRDGKDITHFFFEENYFLAPVSRIFFNREERYIWEAIEECQVSSIRWEEFQALEEQYPKLTRLLLGFAVQMLDIFSQKLNLLQFQSASERYALFQEMYPNLNNRISLGATASFLGITQQTLSVARSKKN